MNFLPARMEQGQPQIRPYGLWTSPIGPDLIAGGVRFGDVAWDVQGGELVWLESRQGHGTLFASNLSDAAPRQLTTTLNVRGRLGYGGGEFTVADGDVYFAADGRRLYRQSLQANDPRPITPSFGTAAAPAVAPDGHFVAYVHSDNDIDRIAVVDSDGRRWPHILVEGDDFYMQPRWNPDGELFAFVAWNFPHMPWDGTELRLGRFDRSAPGGPRLLEVATIAGAANVSVMQPEFSPDGRLLSYISDTSGYWQIYAYDLQTGQHTQLTDAPHEHGVPAWVQGMRTYGFAPDGRALYYIRNEGGQHRLLCCTLFDAAGHLRPAQREITFSRDELAVITQIAVPTAWPASDESPTTTGSPKASAVATTTPVAFIASAPSIPPRIIVTDVVQEAAANGLPRIQIVRRSQAENFIPGTISQPQAVEWRSGSGTTVHGLYYPPTNPHYTAPDGPPPAVISIHSGPTAQSMPDFNAKAQFFTSRGYAYIEPNYRGSTGFGREYRNLLQGSWGVVDMEDAVAAAQLLVDDERSDARRLVIMGSSAGGYTALRALCERPGFFRAAICMYGVADLFGLALDTHKFERHYTDGLVGPLPEAADLYRERSPVLHAHKITDAVAVFQGTDDNVVPKSQSDAIVAALRSRGVPHEYHVYEGEGHGWRNTATIAAVYGAIERFLQRHVIFT